MNKPVNFPGLLLLLILTGCTLTTLDSNGPAEPLPTPTTFHFFQDGQGVASEGSGTTQNPTGVPTVASLFTERNTPTPKPSATPRPTFSASEPQSDSTAPDAENLFTYYVFDDVLDDNWAIIETIGATVDMTSDIRIFEGDTSIAFTPEEDFTSLFFTVKPSSNIAFPAEKVLALSFWINGGDDYIQLEQLALSVIGSNDYTYWSPDDNSVEFPRGESFSETRLYFLGLNRSVPPNTWTEVYLQIDTLIYDPEYNYLVGFYLKNDLGFRNTIYLDEIKLVLLEDPSALTIEPAFLALAATAVPTTPPVTAIPADTAVATTTPTATTAEAACTVSPPAGWIQYAVQPGDNLSSLAFNRGESAEVVLAVNCFRPGVVLSIGQLIWLPPAP